ncbi:MAG: class I SAM-dependent methyltransferase [Planctomycetota bacterium]
MDHHEVGRMWNANAPAWTELARAGYDTYRDHVNTPAFFALLPQVKGRVGLDIGCGEGHNTRLLAERGARLTAIDISAAFIAEAQATEREKPLGIDYRLASAVALPFADAAFDFATGFMSFMDIPEQQQVIREAHRVLKPDGFLQFSICHPCFQTPHWQWVSDESGARRSVLCGDYFSERQGVVDEWIFGAAPTEAKARLAKFKIPVFFRTLSTWLNWLIAAGFVLEGLAEPTADAATVAAHPELADTRQVAYFLILRCRKPGRTDRPRA